MRNQRNRIARFLIIIAMVLLGCYAGLTAIRTVGADSTKKAAPPIPALPTRSGPAAIRHLEQTGLYNSLSAAVTAARYEIEERKVGGYQASNPKQGYRSIFTREGVEVRGTSRTGEDWRMGMKLIGYGYGERKQVVTSAGLKASGDRIEYERRAREGRTLSEWYVNRAEGLEQGFTIAQAPGKRRAGERLSLWLKLSGDLQARLLESGQAIMLNGSGAGAGLRYEKLHAFDATGRGLEARMKLAGDQVKLEVADEGAIYPVMIDPTFTQQQKLEASDGAAGDLFGRSVAISGETVVVGASNDDDAVANQGSAYVFVRSGGVWSQQQKLVASDPASEDRFGDSVAISGETIVIGARLDNGTGGGDQGSAYVFVRSGGVWSQQQKLEASDPAAADVFGQSVAISSETVVVGAPSHDGSGGGDQGSAYVFVRSAGVWSQQQELEASDGAGSDNFGFSVAISGETVVVGARSDDGAAGPGQGSAYIFVRSGGVWSQQQKIEASDAASIDQFGSSVAVSGETAVVGAPNDDGVAGLDQGSAYVFVRSGGVWSQQQKLEASDAGAGDRFGTSVAINGNTIVVGADSDDGAGGLDQGSAYVFAPANQPPDCSGAFPSIATIWPPNHQFVNVTIQGVTDPDGDPVTITIDQIKQDEPTDGTGDGHTCPDGAGIGTSTAQVRAERSAHGNGRVYTIFFTASDGNGGSCQNSVTVCVPRTNNGTCTNGGASFDSTECDTSLNWHSGDTLVTHGPSADQPPSWENYCLLGGLLHLILNDPPCLP
jgi:FG-GAP repeat protein